MPLFRQGWSWQSSTLVSHCLPVYPSWQVHMNSSMRSVHTKLFLQGFGSQLLISEKKIERKETIAERNRNASTELKLWLEGAKKFVNLQLRYVEIKGSPWQSFKLLDPFRSATVVPGHGTQARLSMLGWNERRLHNVHGTKPVGEKEPGGQGTNEKQNKIK